MFLMFPSECFNPIEAAVRCHRDAGKGPEKPTGGQSRGATSWQSTNGICKETSPALHPDTVQEQAQLNSTHVHTRELQPISRKRGAAAEASSHMQTLQAQRFQTRTAASTQRSSAHLRDHTTGSEICCSEQQQKPQLLIPLNSGCSLNL